MKKIKFNKFMSRYKQSGRPMKESSKAFALIGWKNPRSSHICLSKCIMRVYKMNSYPIVRVGVTVGGSQS